MNMSRKNLYGIWGILAAAVIIFAAASMFGKTIKINYIEQIHLQDDYLYYVDRDEGEKLRIIRSNPDGGQGELIVCQKHVREQYRTIRQIFLMMQARHTYCWKKQTWNHGTVRAVESIGVTSQGEGLQRRIMT